MCVSCWDPVLGVGQFQVWGEFAEGQGDPGMGGARRGNPAGGPLQICVLGSVAFAPAGMSLESCHY